MIHTLLIINQAGSLTYTKDFSNGANKLTTNEYLILAGTIHSVHAISAGLLPVSKKKNAAISRGVSRRSGSSGTGGFEVIEAQDMKLHCYETPTGIKFIIVADKNHGESIKDTMRGLYLVYSDYVLKSPFYNPEMPIRSEIFDKKVSKLLDQ
ncbi:hypothetical protein H4219_002115 [Mycoemilia scoparia]|uniref:Trafficking protein particle complex subunit n=1 Tax=Mycoemilia scoparia TaxID=417184 RepID=A0A9W8A7U3_9FUNG|nr:hypothetical protein H4219_002115 [Mycoemilia scoparia]